jgi:hypothetical protein
VTASRTSASAAVTGSSGTFQSGDVGRTVTGTGIPAGATIAAVASSTAATLSASATTTTSGSVVLGAAPAGAVYGFNGWSPESDAEAATYTVAGVNAGQVSPDRISSPNVGRTDNQRSR